jgi:hypothetical protein
MMLLFFPVTYCLNIYFPCDHMTNDITKAILYSKPISILAYFFFIFAEFMILYCKDNLGCIDNNNIELINNSAYLLIKF